MLQLRQFNGMLVGEAKNADSQQISGNLAPSLFSDFEIDPDLRLIIKQWPNLPEYIKASIKALAELTEKPENK